jgi:hypothetical protein
MVWIFYESTPRRNLNNEDAAKAAAKENSFTKCQIIAKQD